MGQSMTGVGAGSALVRGLLALLVAIFLAAMVAIGLTLPGSAFAAEVPAAAKPLLPILAQQQRTTWPDLVAPEFLAGQIEQESCLSLTHSKCWNPRAELKTKRENGIGLGQFTRAYRADGSIRFDKIGELAAAYPSLKGWGWANRYDARYQLTALVEMDHGLYRQVRDAATERDRKAFTLSGYNGGAGGVLQDRRLCGNTRGCDPGRWAGHVERTSLKSRVPVPGYKQSFFAINREYVHNILDVRSAKYRAYFVEPPHG
jgi:hypothetical protein